MKHPVIVRRLGCVGYLAAWREMTAFNETRDPATTDEIWLLEHSPVFTVGLKGKGRQLSNPQGIPFVHSDRGGDVTYHGPGQRLVYVLMDLQRRRWGVKQLVSNLEQAVIDLLAEFDSLGERRAGAPGVYVAQKKLAALGLRIRGGRSYHGLAINVNMDLAPFTYIDPCGFPGLEVTQLADVGIATSVQQTDRLLLPHLLRNLEYMPPVNTAALADAPA
jgi:lipoyl(octanoyl) transferase